jgi:thymidine phosphorylase
MEGFTFSHHALDRMRSRKIDQSVVEQVLSMPDSVTTQKDSATVYQAMLKDGDKYYMFRVFVNELATPKNIISIYKTSKISKYYES